MSARLDSMPSRRCTGEPRTRLGVFNSGVAHGLKRARPCWGRGEQAWIRRQIGKRVEKRSWFLRPLAATVLGFGSVDVGRTVRSSATVLVLMFGRPSADKSQYHVMRRRRIVRTLAEVLEGYHRAFEEVAECGAMSGGRAMVDRGSVDGLSPPLLRVEAGGRYQAAGRLAVACASERRWATPLRCKIEPSGGRAAADGSGISPLWDQTTLDPFINNQYW